MVWMDVAMLENRLLIQGRHLFSNLVEEILEYNSLKTISHILK
jgi:hypothetical protein